MQQPAGVYKCNHPRCLTCPVLQQGQTNYIFTATSEQRKIIDHLSCKSKNLIYLIQCNKWKCQYILETKRYLNERFGEHCRSMLNHQRLSDPTPVSLHFNQAGHSINDVTLIALELIRSNLDAVRKAREAPSFFLSPNRDHVKTQAIHVFLNFFTCNPKFTLLIYILSEATSILTPFICGVPPPPTSRDKQTWRSSLIYDTT